MEHISHIDDKLGGIGFNMHNLEKSSSVDEQSPEYLAEAWYKSIKEKPPEMQKEAIKLYVKLTLMQIKSGVRKGNDIHSSRKLVTYICDKCGFPETRDNYIRDIIDAIERAKQTKIEYGKRVLNFLGRHYNKLIHYQKIQPE